jgi:diguanylate cyclase (GGDEF)-like protein/PAS domain S-box-containing protein
MQRSVPPDDVLEPQRPSDLEALVDANVDGMLVVDRRGRVLYANPAAVRLLGREAEALVGSDFGLPLTTGEPTEIDLVAGARTRVAELRVAEIRWRGSPAKLAALREITARRKAEEGLRHVNRTLAAVLAAAPVALVEVDLEGRVRSWNRAAEATFGWSADEVVGAPCPLLEDGRRERLGFPGTARDVEGEITRRDGTTVHVAISASPIEEEAGGGVRSVVLAAADVSERHRREEEMAWLATHDPLTSLPNRRAFEDVLLQAAERARREGEVTGALLILDIDRFKSLNDTAGHLAGDHLLVGLARRLEATIGPGELVARFGGDELAVVLETTTAEATREAAERLRGVVASHRIAINGRAFRTTATAGGTVIDGTLGSRQLVAVADRALQAAKDAGRDRAIVRDHAEQAALELAETDRWARRVRRALDSDGFTVEHQPMVDLVTGEAVAHEALVRIRSGVVRHLPGRFLSAADAAGTLWEVDCWMARHAIEELRDPDHLPIWLNLSRSGLGHPALLELLTDAAPSGVTRRLGFEVTESALLSDLMRAEEWLSELRRLGCGLALDDFGVHSSSFAGLRALPIDVVKVDRSFLARLADDPANRSIVRGVADVCHQLGRAVVAEGIEDEVTRTLAQELGADLGQGFLWSGAEIGSGQERA